VGILLLGGFPQFSKRSVINMNQTAFYYEYAFIDHIKSSIQFGGPGNSSPWNTVGGPVWGQNIDADGWPNYSTVTINKRATFGGILIPASSNFAGPYTIDGFGSGTITLSAGSWTLGAATGVSLSTNTLTVTDQGVGVRWTAQLTYSGSRGIIGLNANVIDPLNTGKFLRDVRWYRTADASDLAAGKVFRSPWKQTYVDWCPSALRFMNWTGGNDCKLNRFENRTLPSYASYTGNYNWVAGPKYGETTGTNQIVLAAVTGTTASMQHGEMAICRITNSTVRQGTFTGGNVDRTVQAISNAATPVVQCNSHGFNSGDTVVHFITAGMTKLHQFPCTITVTDANHYNITNFNSTSAGTFTAGTVNQYISLQVGSGSDRTAYPVIFSNGTTYASAFGDGYIVAGDYKTFYFDKTISAQTDGSGNLVYGVWIFNQNGVDKGHEGGIPLEVCTALVNELNAMSPVRPIHMWVTVPHWAMLSSDSDYSAGSNYAVKTADVVLSGANGFSGLDSTCYLFIEYSNETWNNAAAFPQATYLARRGQCRSGAAWVATTITDYASMVGLRSYLMAKDIQAAFPGNSRIKYVLAGQGTLGIAGGTMNYLRVHGTTAMLTDSLNPGGAEPMSVHDFFAWAAYVYNDDSNATYSLATCTTAWLAAGSDPVAKEAAYALYVQGIKTFGGTQTIDQYYGTLMPSYASAMVALGKQTMMYEGGWDHAIAGSADNISFLTACKQSQSWATALKNAQDTFNSVNGAIMPADYIQIDARWGHADPDLYSGGVEGAALDLAWLALGTRNRALS
jgi:hypothetical protein